MSERQYRDSVKLLFSQCTFSRFDDRIIKKLGLFLEEFCLFIPWLFVWRVWILSVFFFSFKSLDHLDVKSLRKKSQKSKEISKRKIIRQRKVIKRRRRSQKIPYTWFQIQKKTQKFPKIPKNPFNPRISEKILKNKKKIKKIQKIKKNSKIQLRPNLYCRIEFNSDR